MKECGRQYHHWDNFSTQRTIKKVKPEGAGESAIKVALIGAAAVRSYKVQPPTQPCSMQHLHFFQYWRSKHAEATRMRGICFEAVSCVTRLDDVTGDSLMLRTYNNPNFGSH